MAENQNQNQNKSEAGPSVERLAFDLFSERTARIAGRAENIAVRCFQDAETFLDVAGKFRRGELKTEKANSGPKMSDVSVPKLPKTHPHNIVSRRFGNMKAAKEAHDWLKANPLATTCGLEHLGINWDEPQTKLARIILPEYFVDQKEPANA